LADYQTIRIWTETLEDLRLIYGMTGEKMVEILDRLVKAELARLKQEKK
jgi:hypothetical protein